MNDVKGNVEDDSLCPGGQSTESTSCNLGACAGVIKLLDYIPKINCFSFVLVNGLWSVWGAFSSCSAQLCIRPGLNIRYR